MSKLWEITCKMKGTGLSAPFKKKVHGEMSNNLHRKSGRTSAPLVLMAVERVGKSLPLRVLSATSLKNDPFAMENPTF